MPEPLKNLFNEAMIATLNREICVEYPEFKANRFKKAVFCSSWDELELKDRMAHISKQLHEFLPDDYSEALSILKPVSARVSGFQYMLFPGFVELFGLDEYEESIAALEHFTKYSSSEFAVRPFIKRYPKKMMAQMKRWANSDNYHVRRLATEGCRPRLPWAMALPDFKENPKPVLPILKKLKNDESEYVRRSVANNLNDIAKDNPEIVIEIAKSWLGKNENTDRLVKHACRTLLKAGDPEVLPLFGYGDASHVAVGKFKIEKEVRLGDTIEFEFELSVKSGTLGKLRLEYGVYFMKSNGKQARKIFKISESDYQMKNKKVVKRYSFKAISTRKYYVGEHAVVLVVNGLEVARKPFMLIE